jgi:hypothetical protein
MRRPRADGRYAHSPTSPSHMKRWSGCWSTRGPMFRDIDRDWAGPNGQTSECIYKPSCCCCAPRGCTAVRRWRGRRCARPSRRSWHPGSAHPLLRHVDRIRGHVGKSSAYGSRAARRGGDILGSLVPDTNASLRIQIELVGLADTERIVERVHVADDAVAAELRR